MNFFSARALGLLTTLAQQFTRSELETMIMTAGLAAYDPPGAAANKRDLLLRHLRGGKSAADDGDVSAQRALVDFLLQVIPNVGPATTTSQLDQLYEALLADGYQLTMSDGKWALLSTDPSPVPLAPEMTALEAELAERGYDTVLIRYRQAVDGLLTNKYESANGDLRAVLEDLVTRLAEDYAGYQRTTNARTGLIQANQGTAAISHLIQTGSLPENDGGKLLQGLWAMTHTNGPHPGVSDADEARFRMQMITGVSRFLLKHFGPTS